jgi:CBS domain-containing protein
MLVDAIMNVNVATVGPDHTVLRAARLMRDKRVGSVVVVDEHRRPVGLLTDRDIAIKLVADGTSPETPVDALMSRPVYAVSQSSLIFDVLREMSSRRVHRVPVVDADTRLVGIVSIDDALLILCTELNNIADVVGGSSRVLGEANITP